MRTPKLSPVSGDLLIADFQTVLTGRAMTQVAAQEAERSENELMNQLASLSRGGYLSPGNLSNTNQSDITMDSLNVHVKKVQAEQLASLSSRQVTELVQQARLKYTGRRVVVTPLNYKNAPVDSVWFDPQSGYRTSQIRKRKVVGVIEDVQLDENMLILKPTLQRRLVNPGLQNYLVYIIDPSLLVPLITLEVL